MKWLAFYPYHHTQAKGLPITMPLPHKQVPSAHKPVKRWLGAVLSGLVLSAVSIPAQAVPNETAVQPSQTTPAALPSTDTTTTLSRSGGTANTEAAAAAVSSRLVLRLNERRVYLYRDDMLVSSYPVAVGTNETPTPQGQFAVIQKVVNPVWQSPWTGEVHEPGPDSALGLRWIEFATSDEGAFGFHGTPTLDSIGNAASNGCVRMRNEDVVALFTQVEVGTPVVVQP